jgi:hypothetical protein
MVKNVLIIFGILISIFLMLVISLINGFKIDNISFKNINIQGLYLKYDKKLIIDTRNVSIGYLSNTKSVDMKIKFSIESFFDKYYIEVQEYLLFDPYLKASGKFVVDLDNLSLESILKDTTINDFALQFNNNLKFITANSCFVTFKENNFYFTFNNPVYEGVSLEGSKATIIDLERLELELTSNDKLKKPLLELLSNYKINLPLRQEYGLNTISTELLIPFDIRKELKVQSKIKLKDAKVYLYNIPLYTKNFDIFLDNNILKGSGKLHKENDDNSSLAYDMDLLFDIDFNKNLVVGDFTTQAIKFKELNLTEIEGEFNLDFNSDFFSDIIINKGKLKLKEEDFLLKKSKSTYKDIDKTFYSNLHLKSTQQPFTLKIDDKFNLLDINSTGDAEFSYDSEDIKLFSNTVAYKADYKNNDTKIDALIKGLEGTFFDNSIVVNNTQIHYSNEMLQGDVEKISLINNFVQLDNQNVSFDYNIHKNGILNVDMNNSKLLINNIDIGLKSAKIKYQKDKLDIKSSIINRYSSADIYTNMDLLHKKIVGDIQLFNSTKEKTDNFKYDINYKEGVLFNIPKLDFQLKSTSDNVITASAKNLLPLQNYFNFIGLDGKSNFLLTRDKDANTNINLEHISVILDEYDTILQKDKEKKTDDNKINLYWKNSFVKFDDYKFYFDKANLEIVKENLHLELQKNTTDISIDKIGENTIIKSKRVDASYINSIFDKEILKDGYLEMFLTGGYNAYQGDFRFYKTTIVKMQLVDNLLLFLNSTPALINPLLAIPTVYRLIENKFELGGYYIEDGIVKFNYNQFSKYLDLYKIDTNGKINDFEGNIRLNFMDNTIDGKLQVSTLKDYAKIVNNIPFINSIFLDSKGKFSIPISIYGTIDNPNYKILNLQEKNQK